MKSTLTTSALLIDSPGTTELCNGAIVELVEEYDTVLEILHCLFPDISTQDWKAIVHKIHTQAKGLLLWDTRYTIFVLVSDVISANEILKGLNMNGYHEVVVN